jgi:hypothetical protein
MGLRIITSVSLDSIRASPGATALAGYRGNPLHQSQQLSHVVTVGAGEGERQRDAMGLRQQVMLAPSLAPIRRIWACFFTPMGGPHRRAVHDSPTPIQSLLPLQFRQHILQESLPHPGSVPFDQLAPAGIS